MQLIVRLKAFALFVKRHWYSAIREAAICGDQGNRGYSQESRSDRA